MPDRLFESGHGYMGISRSIFCEGYVTADIFFCATGAVLTLVLIKSERISLKLLRCVRIRVAARMTKGQCLL